MRRSRMQQRYTSNTVEVFKVDLQRFPRKPIKTFPPCKPIPCTSWSESGWQDLLILVLGLYLLKNKWCMAWPKLYLQSSIDQSEWVALWCKILKETYETILWHLFLLRHEGQRPGRLYGKGTMVSSLQVVKNWAFCLQGKTNVSDSHAHDFWLNLEKVNCLRDINGSRSAPGELVTGTLDLSTSSTFFVFFSM